MPSTDPPSIRPASPPPAPPHELCPICGADALYELKCKVICRNCRSIVRSCADLD